MLHSPRFCRQLVLPLLLTLVTLTMTVAPGRADELTDMLDRLPADTAVALLLPNPAAASAKLAQLAQTFGVQEPMVQDLFGSLKMLGGMVNGVRDDAPLLLAVNLGNAQTVEEMQEPVITVLIPVTDYAAFAGNYGVLAQGVQQTPLPSGQPGFLRPLEGYALLSNQQVAAEQYAAGGRGAELLKLAGRVGTQTIQQSDLTLLYVIEPMRPLLQQGLTVALAQFEQGVAGNPQMPAEQAAQMAMILKLYGALGAAVARDGELGVIALDFSDTGVGMTVGAQFKPDTACARFFPGSAAPARQLLRALPAKPFLLALAFDGQALDVPGLADAAMALLPEDHPVAAMYRPLLPALKLMKGYGSAWYAPANAAGFNPAALDLVTHYASADPKGLADAITTGVTALNGKTVPSGMDADITYQATVTPGVMQIEGKDIAQFQLMTQYPPQMLQQMGPMAPFVQMFASANGYFAATDDGVVLTMNPNPALIKDLLVKPEHSLDTDPLLQNLDEHALPAHPAMEIHVNVSGFLQAVAPLLAMFAPQLQIDAPADLPPVSFGLGVQDAGFAYRMYLPVRTVKTVVDLVQQAQGLNAGAPGNAPGNAPANEDAAGGGEGQSAPARSSQRQGPPPAPIR